MDININTSNNSHIFQALWKAAVVAATAPKSRVGKVEWGENSHGRRVGRCSGCLVDMCSLCHVFSYYSRLSRC